MSSNGGHPTSPTGLLDLQADAYHRDEITDTPTLSASIVKTLIDYSPAHAQAQHPKLNPAFARVDEDRFDLGTAAHALFLEGDSGVHIVYANGWKTKAAKDERELARQHGRIPMLEKHWLECELLVTALRAQCDSHPDGPFFTDGTSEQTLVWEDDYGVICRARLDWLRDDHFEIHDLKTTRASANPEAWTRTTLWGMGAEIQVAFYLRGCKAVLNREPHFRFVVAEVAPPYAISVVSLAPDALALANRKIDYALKTWAMCLRNDEWPGYEQRVAFATVPPWMEAAWLERELREVTA